MKAEIIVALISGAVSLAGIIITALITNSLVAYRVKMLEAKVDKHNTLIERMYKVETEIENLKERITK